MPRTAKELFDKIYINHQEALSFLLPHSEAVAKYGYKIATKLKNVDANFVYNASLYHDIGVYKTNAPKIGCYGNMPYLQHGIIGSEILKEAGFDSYASVCITHIGVAITKNEIIKNSLPLPHINMKPKTIEEEIIAYSDCFFSKSSKNISEPKSFEKVLKSISKFGERSKLQFLEWHNKFL